MFCSPFVIACNHNPPIVPLPARHRARCLRLLLFLAALAFLPRVAAAQTWNWSADPERVDTAGKFTALAVDKSGNVHLAYAGGEGSELKYAFRPHDTGKWFDLSLEKQLGSFAVSIALDSAGNPHICYTPRVLKIADWDGKQWHIQEVDAGHGTVEYNCSATFAADGTPFLAWYQTRGLGGANFLHIKFAYKKDGVWYAKTIDYDREAGKWNSVVIDSGGHPHIAYSAFPPGDLKYAFSDGKEWHISSVDFAHNGSTKDATGMGISLALDPQSQFAVTFYEAPINGDTGLSPGLLKIARLVDGKWKIEPVAPIMKGAGWVEFTSDLVFDHEGRPHIRYEDGGAVRHAFFDGTRWRVQTVVAPGGEPYLYSSMKIAPDDTIYISYRDPIDGSLRVAVGAPVPAPIAKVSAAETKP
jgi:hypothetical protein